MFKHGINRVLIRKVKLNKKLPFFSKYRKKQVMFAINFSFFLSFGDFISLVL